MNKGFGIPSYITSRIGSVKQMTTSCRLHNSQSTSEHGYPKLKTSGHFSYNTVER